jgi:predicted MPP superfamily phosphohydrolase
MFIHLTWAVLFLYLLFRFILPLRTGWKQKVAAGVLLFALSQQHMFNRLVFGGLSSPEIPGWLLISQGWCLTALLFLFAIVLGRDLLLLGFWLAHKLRMRRAPASFSPDRREFLYAVAAGIPAAYGVKEALAVPETREREIVLPRLPKELDGLRLAQITDLHVSPLLGGDWVREVTRRVNDLKPDLILFTGDMVDGRPRPRADGVAPLRDLRAVYGIYGCVGNHEYYSDYRAWLRVFPSLGITMLLNSHAVLSLRGKRLVLAGVTDMAARRFSLPEGDPVAALRGAPKDCPRIMLDHRPVNAAANARLGVDLQLSGHTHGGQMPGLRTVVERFNAGFVYGWYTVGGMPMYVSSGAGLWNGFPVRIGVPSELPCITLRSA